jgi:SAM-dependent methyltransferase
MSQLCPDVILFPESPVSNPDRWVLMNVFTRDCLGVGPEVLPVLANPDQDTGAVYRVWHIWRFSHSDGLLADPSRFRRDASTWGEPSKVDHQSLLKLLENLCILISDIESYKRRFGPKNSILDRHHFGTYHQQLGQQLIAFERKNPADWWLEQKFTPDLSAIRKDNLYGAVQDRFLNSWLPRWIRPGMRILDIGCGPGTIAHKLSALGASVLGVDPNPNYIRLARQRAVGDLRFEVLDLNSSGALDSLPDASFDAVYMSDALLFYFVPYEPGKPLDLKYFIASLKRLLKPGGTFLSLEPHPVFYVLPWLGSPERPFTVVTEYLRIHWRINPPLAQLTKPFLDEGFVITRLEELSADASDPNVEPRAAAFAAEFPLWLLLEFKAPCAL